ncbi:hypothetical protein AALO_G00089560 [Alosa alosa]|uniref:Uncharacterized protein n=1 Tax=Alosa alosa TaxID=278164 RepID=A0AAV6GVR7_9TELE|nr:hypothetical protein AALO_G00089560 [Alosa alosa]
MTTHSPSAPPGRAVPSSSTPSWCTPYLQRRTPATPLYLRLQHTCSAALLYTHLQQPCASIQLNTIYGSQYGWDVSNYSLADAVVDSGKASDLSVCSWPIEPIQWTPFPLLQQLHTQNTLRSSRPRSYCEGMELVDLRGAGRLNEEHLNKE